MKIVKEIHLPGWGEHDFYFDKVEDAAAVTKTLRESGFSVGTAWIPGRVTIATDVGPGVYKARAIIEKMA